MEQHGESPSRAKLNLFHHKTWAYELRSSERFTIFAVAVAMFVDSFIYSMIIPIIPKILGDLGQLPVADVQTWVAVLLAAYGAALIAGSLIFGYISDNSRHRKFPFFIGLVSMAGTIALFFVSTSPPVLVIARLLQGLAAGGVWVAGLALVANRVNKNRIGDAMGYTTLGMTWGGLLGPFTGIIYERFGYYASFVIPLSLLALDIGLRLAIIEDPECSEGRLINKYNTFSRHSSEATPCLTGDNGTNDSAPFSLSFPQVDSESQQLKPRTPKYQLPPMIQLLGNPRILITLLEIGLASSILSAFEATLPLFVIERFGWGSAGAGLIFLSLTIPSTGGILVGRLADKIGFRCFVPLAFLLSGPTIFLMRYITGPSMLNIITLIGLLGLTGLSIVVITIITMTEIFHSVSEAEAKTPEAFGPYGAIAQAYAMLNISYACGQFAGPLIAGVLKDGTGWQGMTLVLSLCCIPMAFFVGIFNWWTHASTPAS